MLPPFPSLSYLILRGIQKNPFQSKRVQFHICITQVALLSTLVKSLVFFAIPCFGRKQLTRVELSAEPHTDMDAQKAYERRMAELHGPEEEQTMPCASQASDQDLTETHLDTGKTTTLCVTSSRNLATSTKRPITNTIFLPASPSRSVLIDEESLLFISEKPLSARDFLLPSHPLPTPALLKICSVLGAICFLYLCFNLLRLTLLVSNISAEFQEGASS